MSQCQRNTSVEHKIRFHQWQHNLEVCPRWEGKISTSCCRYEWGIVKSIGRDKSSDWLRTQPCYDETIISLSDKSSCKKQGSHISKPFQVFCDSDRAQHPSDHLLLTHAAKCRSPLMNPPYPSPPLPHTLQLACLHSNLRYSFMKSSFDCLLNAGSDVRPLNFSGRADHSLQTL